ncbi:AIR synthase family protein [Clostridium sediminicola]|uniref:AIR synthase family protein n=1 Tax=Clostridium sediminicola TaxID=3114879 RepID=UPI0031F273FA
MRIGKLSSDDLKKIINNNRGYRREEVRIRSKIGEDCSVVSFGEFEGIFSTDPITAADVNIGKLAVHINANDIASCGVEPLGILVTILASPKSNIEDIQKIMSELHEECCKLKIEIIGGHTEVTDAVNKTIVSVTVIGKAPFGKAVATSTAKVGDDIIVTKKLGLEGTTIIVNDFYSSIKDILTKDELEEAKSYDEKLSVVKEGVVCGKIGVHAMHDITEGGVLGALWEMAEASNVGFKIYKDKMPITDITQKLCDYLEINPLKFISSGSMLICTENGDKAICELRERGIEATIIGNITDEGKVLVENNRYLNVDMPEEDELYRLFDNN